MFEGLTHWVIEWAESPYAVWALFFLSVAESSFFPIPPDVLLVPLVLSNPDQGLWLAGVTTTGSVIGGVIGYCIGFFGGQPILERFFSWGTIRKVKDQFDRYGGWAVGVAGFTPIPYKVFTVASGVFSFRVFTFVLASFIGRGGRFFLVATAIQLFGEKMLVLMEQYYIGSSIVLVVLVIAVGWAFHVLRQRGLS